MSFNGKYLAKAQADLSLIREKNIKEHDRRLSLIYSKIPAIKDIDSALMQHMFMLTKLVISNASESDMNALRDENLSLQQKRAELLVQNGFPRDYLDDIYTCKLCSDSGRINNKMCSCLVKLYNKALTKDLSSLLKNGDESFENFNLDFYSGSDRKHMEAVLSLARQYADEFPDIEDNLLLTGNPGLGKTYLSACIARQVAERGYSVCYVSAIDLFKDFDDARFRQDDTAAEKCARYLDCDLLILDDLGTELLLPSVVTYLYNIINTRIKSSRGMIFNSNLTKNEIIERYSAAIGSRINGYFTVLDFVGDDIRKKLL